MICKLKKNSNTVFNSQKIRMQHIKGERQKEKKGGQGLGGEETKEQTSKL